LQTLTVAYLKHKNKNNQLNVKNLETSTELRELLKLHSVLKFTTSSGSDFLRLLRPLTRKRSGPYSYSPGAHRRSHVDDEDFQ